MKKDIFRYMTLVMVAIVSMTFMACGGADDDEIDQTTIIGVHRIDVEFSGNIDECMATNVFYALKPDTSFGNIYEGGKQLQLEPTSHTWTNKEIRAISVLSEDGCVGTIAGIIVISKNSEPISSDLMVTMTGYVNNKFLKKQVFTLPAGYTSISIPFSTTDTELHDAVIR